MTIHRFDRHLRPAALMVIIMLWVSLSTEANDQNVLRERVAELSSTQNPMVDGAPIATILGITKLYQLRSWEPVWTDPSMVRQLYDGVLQSAEHGLNPDDFHAHQLGARLDAGPAAGDPIYRADTEILCSDAFARLLVTLRFGKLDPSTFDTAWNFSREILNQDPVLAINGLLQSRQVSGAFEMAAPGVPKYDLLRQALVTYQDIGAKGGWPRVPEGDGMKLGSTGPRVVVLRYRLRVTGDFGGPTPANPEVFDEQLEAAAKRFQRRHGIAADGAVGPRSLEELNVPVEDRIDQIRTNLERARWVFRDIEDTFIIVNIAGFYLELVEHGERTWRTKVQVGKPYHATPVFKSTLKYAEFNPTWTIPPGILRKETLPAIRRDPSYLSRNNMSVVTTSGTIVDPATIDWAATTRGFPYMIRQEPGTRNALGRVKFIFPNKYMVYLHDTPSKGLFARAERAFSHGCIRTENPFDLAVHLFDDQGWDRARIDRVVESRKTTRVNLEKPVTVMLLYWTADADEDGTVFFHKDVYGRDARIIRGLDEPFRIDPPKGAREAVDGRVSP